MIIPGHRVRILIAAKPVDFRKGLDGLTVLVKTELQRDPYTDSVFLFRSRRADRLKPLYLYGSGLVLTYKSRLPAQAPHRLLRKALVQGNKQSQIDDLLPWNYVAKV